MNGTMIGTFAKFGAWRGHVAIVLGAGLWGLFWIPLRYLDERGVNGLWAVSITLLCAGLITLPLLYVYRRELVGSFRMLCMLGLGIGGSTTLYFAGVIFSDVVRVIFLFYMLPVWATVIARVLYGQPFSKRNLLAISLALFGLYLFLGGDGGLPIPKNLGDWFGLGAGFLWALSLAMLHDNAELNPHLGTSAPFIAGALVAGILGMVLATWLPQTQAAFPDLDTWWAAIPAALAFGILMLWPSMFGQVWGAQLVPAPTAALLTMAEILVAVGSAWLLLGNQLTTISLLGGVFILIGAVIDLAPAKIKPTDPAT